MATLKTQTILDNQTKAYKNLVAQYNSANKKYLEDIAKTYDAKRKNAKAQANTSASELEKDFRKSYDLNEIENLIARRQLSEKMAKLGLTQSGLNASSNTALAISRKNADDTVTASKSSALAKIKAQLNSALESIDAAQASDNAKAANDLSQKIASAYKDYNKEYNSTLKSALKQSQSGSKSGSNLINVYGKLYSIKGANNRKAFLKVVTAAGYITESQRKALMQTLNLRDN